MSTEVVTTVIEPRRGWSNLGMAEVWAYRELLKALVRRDVIVRYKQTVLGFLWAIGQPLATMGVFTVVFGNLADVPSEGIPYPLFAFAGLLPWLYFAEALKRAGESVVENEALVSKVYFPRLVAPLAGVTSPLFDLVIALIVLVGLMVWYGIAPGWQVVLLPAMVGSVYLTALAFGTLLAALNVAYRDIKHAVPILIQLWLFLTPVIYPTTLIGERFRFLYALNPLAGLVQGFRWSVLSETSPPDWTLGVSVGSAGLALVLSLTYFQRVERRFADII